MQCVHVSGACVTCVKAEVESKVVGVNGRRLTRLVSLESEDYKYTDLLFEGPIISVIVVKRLSKTAPVENKNYGSHKRFLWVDQGCRALFRVTVEAEQPVVVPEANAEASPAAESMPSPPGGPTSANQEDSTVKDNEKEGKEAEKQDEGEDVEDEDIPPARNLAAMRELKSSMPVFLKAMWNFTAVDMQQTLNGVCTRLFTDVGVGRDIRKSRARAIRALGEILLAEARRITPATGKGDAKSRAMGGNFEGDEAWAHVEGALAAALMKAQQDSNEET
uniref:DNAJ-containing protein X-domain domain-containing protein n=1 Tax=Lotharella globosa TaxID=91324 RepID=A0A7S3YPE4_9EUKA